MLEPISETIDYLLGISREAGEITTGQMALRAFVMYGFTLLIVRLGSTRSLGKAGGHPDGSHRPGMGRREQSGVPLRRF